MLWDRYIVVGIEILFDLFDFIYKCKVFELVVVLFDDFERVGCC